MPWGEMQHSISATFYVCNIFYLFITYLFVNMMIATEKLYMPINKMIEWRVFMRICILHMQVVFGRILKTCLAETRKHKTKFIKRVPSRQVKAGNKSLIQMTLLDEILYIINHCSFKQLFFKNFLYTNIFKEFFVLCLSHLKL